MQQADTLFYSDFNCPFCYALNERLVASGLETQVQWRGIEHFPGIDSGVRGASVSDPLNDELRVLRSRAREITFNLPDFRPSTRLANAAVYAVRNEPEAKVSLFRTRIYRAYWVEGQDISKFSVLQRIATSCQLILDNRKIYSDHSDLLQWQYEWEGDRARGRLPALYSQSRQQPLLGFPAVGLLYRFVNDNATVTSESNLAACCQQERQSIVFVGEYDAKRCDLSELEHSYRLVFVSELSEFHAWLSDSSNMPDLVICDYESLGYSALEACRTINVAYAREKCTALMLLNERDEALELAAFDAGATDVVFSLGNAKITQARLENHLHCRLNQKIMNQLTQIDHLTQLPNRREFERKLHEEWARGHRYQKPLSLIMIDVDHFKNFNDHYGHSEGDECLHRVAQAIARKVQRESDLVARYGGEEFAVILPDTLSEQAMIIADRIKREMIQIGIEHVASPTNEIVTLSLGVATMLPSQNRSMDVLVTNADSALYEAKSIGRNCAVYHRESKRDQKVVAIG